MSVYIQGIGNISIQNTFGHTGFSDPVWYNEPYVRCIDPDFKSFISANEARRMSKVIKRAVATAKTAIEESGIDMPDAIISGTGLGCIEDTEKFLSAMIEDDEKFLKPTFFIQSTHNTISSQIAINLKCHSHNNTFVHGGMSFECALTEALLLFADHKAKSALVGGYDEMTPAYFKMLDRVGFWKKDAENGHSSHVLSGEGSVSVMLSDEKNEKSYAEIEGLEVQYQPENVAAFVEAFLKSKGKTSSDIDLVVFGISGDDNSDAVYKQLGEELFAEKAQAKYKHLSGEYFTSTGFGLWFAANCIKTKQVPAYTTLNDNGAGDVQKVLIINHYQNKNYSLMLLSGC